MRRSWKLIITWVSLAVGGSLGVSSGLIAALHIPAPWAALLGGGIATVCAVEASRARQRIDRQSELREALPDHISLQRRDKDFPRVRDIIDPVVLGVHPAERLANGPQPPGIGLTPYISRDIDGDLRSAVLQEDMVVVVGESTAGKSRASFEAIRAQLPDHLLAVPSGRDSLAAVSARLSQVRRSVLWLDDLERFLGPGGLTPAIRAGLATMSDHSSVIVASMRTTEYEHFTARAEPRSSEQDRAAWRAGREILDNAYIITLHRLWSKSELERAGLFADDSRIAHALQQAEKFGISESLAAGPELLRDWCNAWAPGSHPRGAALVAAAVDCRRAGMDGPVPPDLLEDLHHHYLLARGGHLLRPEPIDKAWAWALQPVHGASSLLIPVSSDDRHEHYLAFDYLIDQPNRDPIPLETWNLLVAKADPPQASQVAFEAFWRLRTAFHAAVDSGMIDSVHLRAMAIADRGNYKRAIQVLADTAQSADGQEGDPALHRSARHQIAVYQMLSGRVDEAELMFEELLTEASHALPSEDEYLRVVRHNLASCAGRRGDLPGALAQFRRILIDRELQLGPDAMNTLDTRRTIANIIAKMGDPAEALRLNRAVLADEERALGRDHTNTFETRESIARCLAIAGDPGPAADTLRTLLPDMVNALGAGHPDVLDAQWKLARYLGAGGHRLEAIQQYQRVVVDVERTHDSNDQQIELIHQELRDLLASSERPQV